MKIIKGTNTNTVNQNVPTTFFQGSKLEISLMIIPYLISWVVLLIISFLSPPAILQENIFYPFSSNDKALKVFNFLFNQIDFFHRTLRIECSFVRHHEKSLPQLKIGNHVTENIFFSPDPNFFDQNITDLEYNQEIIFEKDEYNSNAYSYLLEHKYSNDYANLSLIYNTNFSDIAGFNFNISQGNYNVQLLLSQSKILLFLATFLFVFICLKNKNIRNTKFHKLIVILELLSCLSLNPFYDLLGFSYLHFLTPFCLCAFFLMFRIISFLFLEVSHATNQHHSYKKIFKYFIFIYSVLELKEIYDHISIIYSLHPSRKSEFYYWMITCFHSLYFVLGIIFCFTIFFNQKSIASSQITWFSNIVLFIYGFSLLTSFFVNVILRLFYDPLIMNSIFPSLLYQFTMHISVFIYHRLVSHFTVELDTLPGGISI